MTEDHPMGEEGKQPQKTISAAIQTMIVDTLGGRVQVSRDKEFSMMQNPDHLFVDKCTSALLFACLSGSRSSEVQRAFQAWCSDARAPSNSPNMAAEAFCC
jgi:hypothetical protein